MAQMNMRTTAVRFAESVIMRSTDWQQVEDALANDDRFGAWLDASGEPMQLAQSIIREAEERLGNKAPAGYA